MKVQTLAVMALLGLVTAEHVNSVVAHKLKKFNKHQRHQRLVQLHAKPAPVSKAGAGDSTTSPDIVNPKLDKAVQKAVKNARKPMTEAEADEEMNKKIKPIWGPNTPYSNQLANGDIDDDKELEDEDDPRDLIVDDDGFVHQHKINPESAKEWARGGGFVKTLSNFAQVEDEDYSKPGTLPFADLWGAESKYSNQIANGDADDDKEIQDEDDPRDMIVDDDGYVNQFKISAHAIRQWKREGVEGTEMGDSLAQVGEDEEKADDKNAAPEDYSEPGTVPLAQTWGPETPYSNQVANGDADEDKEIQDEDDPRDPIVDDDGYVNQFKMNKASVQEWNRDGVKRFGSLVQDDVDVGKEYHKPGTVPFADLWGPKTPYSHQLSNGDIDDDKEIEDEDDPRDVIADDTGFVNQYKMNKGSVKEWKRGGVKPAGKLVQITGDDVEDYSKPGTVPLAATWGPETPYSNQVANGDKDDDKEIQDEEDPRDPIVDDDGFVNQYKMNKGSVQEWNRDGVKQFGGAKPAGKLAQDNQENQEDNQEDNQENEDSDMGESGDEDEALVQLNEEEAPKRIDPSKIEEASNPEIAGPQMAKGSFEHEVDDYDDDLYGSLVQLNDDEAPKRTDPSKVEEATNSEIAGPQMAKGSFELDVDEEDDNLNRALAIQSIDEENSKKPEEKKAGDKKEKDASAPKSKKDTKAKAAKDAAVNRKKANDEKEGKVEKKAQDDLSEPGSLPMADLWGTDVRYSDQLANGDDADDKELEDEDDPRDIIVDDDGFVNQWDIDMSKAAQWSAVQLGGDVKIDKNMEMQKDASYSSELVNGDKDDDKVLSDINDKDDDEVDENLDLESTDMNLLQLDDSNAQQGKGFNNPGPAWTQIMAQISNKNTIDRIL